MKKNLKTNLKKSLMKNKGIIYIQKEEIKELKKDHKKH